MPRWSTAGAASLIRLVLLPLFGMVVFLLETTRDDVRPLPFFASLVLMGVLPAAALFEGKLGGLTGPPPPPPSPPEPLPPASTAQPPS